MTTAERSLSLPPELSSVRRGRLFAREVVTEWGLESLADDVQLGVSELITNAVRHAGTDVLLTLRRDTVVTVEVRDADPDLRHPAPLNQPDLLATSGRGLHIVAAVSQDWGVTSRPDGKAVWFTLALPDSSSVDADVFTLRERREDGRRPAAPEAPSRSREMQASTRPAS
jgi:anti-sigma regulatory factor (Ser/Thr protein kinase)